MVVVLSISGLVAEAGTRGLVLLACCLNTLVAYGAFAEALAHWEASRVSATLSITPLVTFVAVALAAVWWPDHVQPEQINWLAYGGAVEVEFWARFPARKANR